MRLALPQKVNTELPQDQSPFPDADPRGADTVRASGPRGSALCPYERVPGCRETHCFTL